jgi:hypothetical protein
MMPRQPDLSITQCKKNRHDGVGLELFQAIGPLEHTFIEAHQPLTLICKQRSLKSQIKTYAFLEEIISWSNEVPQDFDSDMAVEIRKLDNPTQYTAENNDTMKQTAGS